MANEEDRRPGGADARADEPVPLHERPNRGCLTLLFLVIIAVCFVALRDSTAPTGLRAAVRWVAVGFFTLNLIGLWVPAVGNALFRAFRR